MPKVSVLIPTYNQKEFLVEAINSVLSQTFKDVEIIVINHGSTDGTEELIAGIFGEKVKLINLPNCPLPACSRNAGLKAATGDLIAFLDSDDIWLPHKLALQIKELEANPAYGWSYGNVDIFEHAGNSTKRHLGPWQIKSGYIFKWLLMGNAVLTTTVLMRRSCLEKAGLFDLSPALRPADDYEFWLRLAYHYPVAAINEVLARYRLTPQQMSGNAMANFEPEKLALHLIGEKLKVSNTDLNTALGNLHGRYFRYAIMCGDPRAGELLKQARQLNPASLRIFLYNACMKIFGVQGMARLIRFEKSVKEIVA